MTTKYNILEQEFKNISTYSGALNVLCKGESTNQPFHYNLLPYKSLFQK